MNTYVQIDKEGRNKRTKIVRVKHIKFKSDSDPRDKRLTNEVTRVKRDSILFFSWDPIL